jgi:hypothetical protein
MSMGKRGGAADCASGTAALVVFAGFIVNMKAAATDRRQPITKRALKVRLIFSQISSKDMVFRAL